MNESLAAIFKMWHYLDLKNDEPFRNEIAFILKQIKNGQ
jgi:hypothetical protein